MDVLYLGAADPGGEILEGVLIIPMPRTSRVRHHLEDHRRDSVLLLDWLTAHGQDYVAIHIQDRGGVVFYPLLARSQGACLRGVAVCILLYQPTAWSLEAAGDLPTSPGELEIDFMERECARLSDAILAPAAFVLDWVRQNGWSLPDAVHALPSSPTAKPPRVPPSSVRQFVVAIPHDRPDRLSLFLKAFSNARASSMDGVEVVFAGPATPAQSAEIDKRTRAWSCGVRRQPVADPKVWSAAGQASLFVALHAPEPWPPELAGCLAEGVAFVCLDAPGVAERLVPADRDRACLPAFPAPLIAAVDRAVQVGWPGAEPMPDNGAAAEDLVAFIDRVRARSPSELPQDTAQPRVSVCLVHFNRPHLLRQAIESLRRQDYPELEVVLTDCSSTLPQAQAYLQSLQAEFAERGWKVVAVEDRYLGAARNDAVRHASGDYILFMDDDNVLKPHAVGAFVRAALASGADILTCANSHFHGEGPPPNADTDVWTPLGGALGPGCFGNCFGDANALVRRSVLDACRFTELYGVGQEDWEFFAAAVAKGFTLSVVPTALYWYRFTDSSITLEVKNPPAYRRSLQPMVDTVGPPLGMALQLGLKAYLDRHNLQKTLNAALEQRQPGLRRLEDFVALPEHYARLLNSERRPVTIDFRGAWTEQAERFEAPRDLTGGQILGWVHIRSDQPMNLRVALVSEADPTRDTPGGVLEKWLLFQPGLSVFRLDPDEMTILEGDLRLGQIRQVTVGGSPGWGAADLRLAWAGRDETVDLISAPSPGVDRLTGDLATREQVLATAQSELAETRGSVARLTEALATREQVLSTAQSELAEARGSVEQMETGLADARAAAGLLEAHLADTRAAVGLLEAHLAETRDAVEQLNVQRNQLLASTSWRVTAPMRASVILARDPLGVARRLRGFLRQRGRRALLRLVLSKLGLARPPVLAPSAPPPPDFGARYDLVMFIGCWEGESKRYRVHNVAAAMERGGYSVRIHPASDCYDMVRAEWRARTVVFFRTPLEPGFRIEETLAHARAGGARIVFDVDDLVFEPGLIGQIHGVALLSPEGQAGYADSVAKYRRLLLASDLVTVTTEPLARAVRALGKPAAVIRNSLNQEQIEAAEAIRAGRPRADRLSVGYFSGSRTHERDFACAQPALLDLMRERADWDLTVVGYLDLGPQWAPYADRVIRLPFMAPLEMLRVLGACDVNLAPLEIGDAFCEAKSELKYFEAALVDTPTVASATEPFRAAIEDGVTGFLAETAKDWRAKLGRLLSEPQLRRDMGRKAREAALERFGIEATAAAAAQALFGAAPAAVEAAVTQAEPAPASVRKHRTNAPLKIDWVVPRLLIGGGGHRNILRAAHHLQGFGHDVALHFTGSDDQAADLRRLVSDHFYPFEGQIKAYDGVFRRSDVIMATHWTTVDAALRARGQTREVMYFVQDFEPAFAPMGSEYVLAENTYRQGLYCITSGPWCERLLRQSYASEADHFRFPVDRDIYRERPRAKRNPNVVFFAKPDMPRRCYEIGVMALAHFHRLRPDVEIVLFGSKAVDPAALGFPATIRAIVPTLEDMSRMYADADLGLVFSTTNPSLVPYEMMASGCVVVDLDRPGNAYNYDDRRDIAFLADPVPEVMAAQLKALLEDPADLAARREAGLAFAEKFPDELAMALRVEALIVGRINRA